MTERYLIDTGVRRAYLSDFRNVICRWRGLAALVRQICHREQTDIAFYVRCRQDCVRHIKADRGCCARIDGGSHYVAHRHWRTRSERSQLYPALQVPDLHDSIAEARSQKLALFRELHATTNRNLLALVRIKHVEFLPGCCLAQNDLAIISTARSDHIVMGPGD